MDREWGRERAIKRLHVPKRLKPPLKPALLSYKHPLLHSEFYKHATPKSKYGSPFAASRVGQLPWQPPHGCPSDIYWLLLYTSFFHPFCVQEKCILHWHEGFFLNHRKGIALKPFIFWLPANTPLSETEYECVSASFMWRRADMN